MTKASDLRMEYHRDTGRPLPETSPRSFKYSERDAELYSYIEWLEDKVLHQPVHVIRGKDIIRYVTKPLDHGKTGEKN